MPENEFEKHVQDKMDELRLRPSDAVWKAVEKEIRKKKRRRLVFFILLLAGLGLAGYSGYTFLDNPEPVFSEQKAPASSNDKKVNNNNNQSSTYENETLPNTSESKIKSPEISSVGGETGINEPKTSPVNDKKTSNQTENRTGSKNIYIPVAKTKTSQKKLNRVNTGSPKLKEQKEITSSESYPPLEKNDVVKNENPGKTVAVETKSVAKNENEVAENTITEEKEITSSSQEEISFTDSTIAGKLPGDEEKEIADNKEDMPKRKSLSKIKWGVEFSAGAVSGRSNPLPFSQSGRFSDITFNSPNTSTSGGSFNPASIAPPSSVKTGPGFKAGVFGEIKLSKRSSISAGIRYAYLGEKIKVGEYRDTLYTSTSYSQTSIPRGVYQGTKQKWHTNAYHFIELPVTYQLQLNKGNKLPITWNAGFSAGYLAGANALVYDTTGGGVYFKQNNLVSKIHFNVNTGFSLQFGNKKKWQWSAGPEISLDMTKLMKENPYTGKRYLLYGGISAKLFLPTIKK